MNDPLDRYLNEVCWAMGGSFSEQQAARDELRAHVRDAAREHEIAGLSPEQAIDAALRDLGDPATVGSALQSSRGSAALRRPLVQPEGALILDRRAQHHLPPPAVVAAIGCAMATVILVLLVFFWPG
jgi:hypothetical protein